MGGDRVYQHLAGSGEAAATVYPQRDWWSNFEVHSCFASYRETGAAEVWGFDFSVFTADGAILDGEGLVYRSKA